jgi:hypothetical protein
MATSGNPLRQMPKGLLVSCNPRSKRLVLALTINGSGTYGDGQLTRLCPPFRALRPFTEKRFLYVAGVAQRLVNPLGQVVAVRRMFERDVPDRIFSRREALV